MPLMPHSLPSSYHSVLCAQEYLALTIRTAFIQMKTNLKYGDLHPRVAKIYSPDKRDIGPVLQACRRPQADSKVAILGVTV